MTEHHPNCEDATGAYPGSCTCKTIAMDNLIAQDADLIDNPLAAAVRELLTDDSMEHLDTFAHNLVQAFDKHGLKVIAFTYLEVLAARMNALETFARAVARYAGNGGDDYLADKARAALGDSHD